MPENFPKITHEQVRPSSIYGAAKVWGEALGRHFSDAHGLSIICVRIGSVTKENRPRNSREQAIYLSQDDVAQMLQKCIDAPDDLTLRIVTPSSDLN